jgi:hypothetical protein
MTDHSFTPGPSPNTVPAADGRLGLSGRLRKERVEAKPSNRPQEERKVQRENLAGRSQGRNRLETENPPEEHGASTPWPSHDVREEKEGRWKHVKYPGWIHWDDAPGGLLIAEIRTRVKDHEWQIMEAFIGYLDRHLGEQIDSISVYYR